MRWIALTALFIAPFAAADEPKPYRSLGSHAGGIASVHFSPDGKLVASGGGDKTVRVTDAATGNEVRSWKGPSSFTCVVRFSPDGKTLAAAGYEAGTGNPIYRFDVATGAELPRLDGHGSGGVRRLLFTPDGRHLVSAGFDGYVRVWDVANGKHLREMKADSGTVFGLAMSPDGKLVATASPEGLRVWEVTTGRERKHAAMNRHNCVAVAFSPDGKLVASGDGCGVTLWELATGRPALTLDGFAGELSGLIFSADGRTLVTSSYDKMIRLWDVRSAKVVRAAEAHTGWVWGISLSPDERRLASCSVDGHVKVWDMDRLGREKHASLKLTEVDAEARWKELAGGDPGLAMKAVWALAGDPVRSVPLLAERLPGSRGEAPAAADIEALIRALDSDDWKEREAATRSLAKVGSHAGPFLQRVMASRPAPEVRRRVGRLLADLDPLALPPEDLAALRGVQALEYTGTAEAKEVLGHLSRSRTGSPRLVEEASLALQRMSRSTGGR